MNELPRFLHDLIGSPPPAGTGVHGWLFRVARQLHAHRNEGEIVDLLRSACFGCGRHVPESEIVAAVQNSRTCAWQPSNHCNYTHTAVPRWPTRDREKIQAITSASDVAGLADVWESSPWRIDDNAQHTEEIVDLLFPGNPLLCAGASSSEFATRPREAWRGELAGKQLIVPSPMSAVTGKRKSDGELSEHTLDNTGARRFLVVELDPPKDEPMTPDDQTAILWHLAEHAPLTLLLHSGGKSFHGWFYCAGQPEDRLHARMHYAVSLGADPATWTRSQFVRMPDGTRDNGKRQTVFYFNPATIKP